MTTTTRHTTVRPLSAAFALAAVAFVAAAGAGCADSRLETGYRFRPLGASDTQRRAFYAPEYSREAAMAQQERPAAADPRTRRPNPGSY